MECFLGLVYWIAILVLLQRLIGVICSRNPRLDQWQSVIRIASLCWCGVAVLKKVYIDDVFPPTDAILHEDVAREIANLLGSFQFSAAFDYFAIGNPAYRFLLGLFYAVTAAPEVITYTVNGALGFWAMLALLEVFTMRSPCRRLPAPIVFACVLLPSGLLWTTTNLKEGLVLWGICMMLYWTVSRDSASPRSKRGLPVVGMVVLGLLRPHIAVIWLLTINLAVTLRARKIRLILLTAGGVLGSLVLLKMVVPAMYESVMGEGVVASLNCRFERIAENDQLVSRHFLQGAPTPVWTGLQLILIRPWPTEVVWIGELLAGAEVWTFAIFGIANWWRLPNKIRHALDPSMVAMIFGLIVFGLFFSYMYNMGLVIRQRLMVYPTVLFIYAWPSLCAGGGSAELGRSMVPHRNRSIRVAFERPTVLSPATAASRLGS